MPLFRYIFLAAALTVGAAQAKPVQFTTADGVVVYADYQGQGDRRLIILFHQAGSNLHEYDPIVPRLQELGFDTLAVSQRSGGSGFGGVNDTARGVAGAPDYLDAYSDMEAALAWAKSEADADQVIVWGSSYSSSLVFKLAADNPAGISALLSFSPGEYFGSAFSVKRAAAAVNVPVFVTSASDSGEIAAAKAITDAVAGDATQFVPKRGVHGSSTLRSDQNGTGAAENWAAVEAFLQPLQ